MGKVRFRAAKNAMDQYLPRFSRTLCCPRWQYGSRYYGPFGLKRKDFGYQQETIECPERVVRKDEEPIDLDLIVNDIENKRCF